MEPAAVREVGRGILFKWQGCKWGVCICVCVWKWQGWEARQLVHLCGQDMTRHCSQTRAGSCKYDVACQTFLLNATLYSAIWLSGVAFLLLSAPLKMPSYSRCLSKHSLSLFLSSPLSSLALQRCQLVRCIAVNSWIPFSLVIKAESYPSFVLTFGKAFSNTHSTQKSRGVSSY